MRFQPQGLSRIRGDLLGRIVGANFTNNRLEIGGSGAEVNLFGGVELVTGPRSTVGRRLVSANSNYATISPPPGLVDFTLTSPYAVICAFVPQTIGVATRILSYRHAADNAGIQLGFTTSNRLGYWFGSSASSGAVRGASAGTVLEVGKLCVVVFGWDNGHFMYIDGVAQGANSITTFVTSNTGTNTDINIGRRNTGSSHLDGSVLLAAHIKGSVDAAALSTNPWQIFEDTYEQDDFLVSSAAVAEPAKFSGAASLQVSAFGVLSTSIRLSGAGALAASASGTLSTGIRLSGAAAAQVSAAGSLTTGVRLTGAAAMRVSAAGALAGAGADLSGAASAQISASGELSTSISLTGAASVRASASGSLAGAGAVLTGGAALQMSAAGVLSSAIRLAGAAVARVSAAGTLGSARVPVDIVDISTISPARIVIFEGSGNRVVPFGSSGSRITPFGGSGSRVTPFEGSGSRTVRFE